MPLDTVGQPTLYPCPICLSSIKTVVTEVRSSFTSTPMSRWKANTSMDFRYYFTIDVDQYPVMEHVELFHGSQLRKVRGIPELGVPDDYQIGGTP